MRRGRVNAEPARAVHPPPAGARPRRPRPPAGRVCGSPVSSRSAHSLAVSSRARRVIPSEQREPRDLPARRLRQPDAASGWRSASANATASGYQSTLSFTLRQPEND